MSFGVTFNTDAGLFEVNAMVCRKSRAGLDDEGIAETHEENARARFVAC